MNLKEGNICPKLPWLRGVLRGLAANRQLIQEQVSSLLSFVLSSEIRGCFTFLFV